MDGSRVLQSGPSPRDGGDPWQPSGVSTSLWGGCCDPPTLPLEGLAKQVGNPGICLTWGNSETGTALQSDVRAGSGCPDPKADPESHSQSLKENSQSVCTGLFVVHPVCAGDGCH